ncbi:hypothetical protein [Amycolatopsis sp. NPDC050768]|uniref:hypothetical protein n=1 Tax=Amycolatopsis sp. NPDC050768 TaxID=3154839 RepID=UPI0033D74CF4
MICALGLTLVPALALVAVAASALALGLFFRVCANDRWVERRFGPRHAAPRAAAAVAVFTAVVGLIAATIAVVAGATLALTTTTILVIAGLWSGPKVLARPDQPRRHRRPAPLPNVQRGSVQRGSVRPVSVRPVSVRPVSVSSLSVEELCLAWRRSYVELEHVRDEESRYAVIAARQAYLDELERRDRQGFTRWLDSGARAAGDPSRFVRPAE